MRARIGFIGIGNMGWPMAERLIAVGYNVVVYDAEGERARRFQTEVGGHAAKLPGEAADVQFLITMLPSSRIVGEVLLGESGVLKQLPTGTIVIEMSSGSPIATQGYEPLLKERGSAIVDAPVSGGVARAQKGDLAIMVGGEDGTIDTVEPVLRCIGSSIIRTGPLGSGHAMKALNNLVSAGGFLIGIEAMMIGQRFGLDPQIIVDVLNSSTGVNNSTQKKFKQFVLSRRFDAGFGLDLLVKDISIANDLAAQTQTQAPFSELCEKLWTRAVEVLGEGRDHTEMARFCEEINETKFNRPGET